MERKTAKVSSDFHVRFDNNVGYFHSEELLESMVTLKEQDYDKYARKMKRATKHYTI